MGMLVTWYGLTIREQAMYDFFFGLKSFMYNLKLFVALIFFAMGILTFTVGPILTAIYLRDPMYLFTYFISWMPATLFFLVGKLLSWEE